MRLRALQARKRAAIGVTVAASAAIVIVLVWAPANVRGWLGGVLVAGLGAYLAQEVTRWGTVASRWRSRRLPPTDPVVVTTKIMDVDYVQLKTGATVPASGHTLRLIVEAMEQRSVLLTALTPIVISRSSAEGNLMPHAGAVKPRRFEVLLDVEPPRVRAMASADFPFKVGQEDPEVFDLVVRTDEGETHWVLDLHWTCSGRNGVTRVDLAGQPFRTAARG